jgi:DNA-directed RNA polymerase specialized sigma24 family protein
MDGTSARRDNEWQKLELIRPERPSELPEDLTASQRAVLANIEVKATEQVERALIDRADRQDIVQQTLLGMWKQLQADPRLWAEDEAEDERDGLQFTITGNAIAGLHRYEKRRRKPDEEIDMDALPSMGRSPQDRLERKDFLHALGLRLDTLKADARRIWCARNLDELDVIDIAVREGMEGKDVSTSLYRTNLALRPMLRADGYRRTREQQP